ncbi:hypothetical protein [uncultured Aquimarina sp.]|uniref:hypothetical protein n=1 Tax=uncultured Aquimarina sp. TaxID=575652 RepID=UPI0026072352|nr:hypothetical protein [uncultured Aquimarina sp.]
MKRLYTILLVLAMIFSCQTKKKEIKNDTQKVLSEKSIKRFVKGHTLVSNKLPEVEISINSEFKFIGKFDFEIIASSDEYSEDMQGKSIAAGERYVFASMDEKKSINKLFIVQFEGFLAENNLIYNYDFSTADFIGENKYRYNTWFYDSKKSAQENPNGEGAKTRAFLEEKGYVLEDQFMMSRFVGLASKDRKNEIIIFYQEMLNKTTGYSLEKYENSISDEEAKFIRDSFIERSKNSFNITRG